MRPSDTGSVSKPGADGNKADPTARAVHGDAPMSEARTGGDTSKELERALRAVKEEIKKLRESQGVFPFVCFACQCHAQVL